MAENADSASKRPEVGRQRRRLARRSGVPRSTTMPVLNPESVTASLVNKAIHTAGPGLDVRRGGAVSGEEIPTPLETSHSMMNFYPPTGIPADLRPSFKDRPSGPGNASPTPTTASTSTTATNGKKKLGFLEGFKHKDGPRGPPLEPPPPPPTTPSKAARVLGIETNDDADDSSCEDYNDDIFDGRYDGLSSDSAQMKQQSKPLLTRSQGAVMSRFKEEDVNPDPPRSKSLWGNSKRIAKTIFAELHELPRQPQPPNRPPPAVPARRKRNKGRSKSLDRMTPITEASNDDLRVAYRDGDDSTELDVISEYEQDFPSPYSQPTLPRPVLSRSCTESLLMAHNSSYELEDDDLSSADEGIEEEQTEEEEEHNIHAGTSIDLNKANWQQHTRFHVQSPLQAVENRLLDAAEFAIEARKRPSNKIDTDKLSLGIKVTGEETNEEEHNMHGSPIALSKMKWQQSASAHVREPYDAVMDRPLTAAEMELEARKFTINKLEASKLTLDVEVAAIKQSHERMKKDFSAMDIYHAPGSEPAQVTGHPACANPNCDRHAHRPEQDDSDEDLVSLRSSIDLDEEPTVHTANLVTFTRITPGMVKVVDIPPRKKPVPLTKKVDPYVKDWVAEYNTTPQRPISERIDNDVLADREVPPAPFPKK